ncbi:MAG: hypothetical protein ACQEQF_03170, partial [Bacillota bacterium]
MIFSNKSKFMICIFIVLVILAGHNIINASEATIIKEELVQIEGDSDEGFHWDYFLYIPMIFSSGNEAKYKKYMMVEPNNTGQTSDDYETNVEAAKRRAEDNYIAKELGVPILVPVFPRPSTIDGADKDGWAYYTHSLDRNTLKIEVEEYKRIDLQLISMIEHAQSLLEKRGLDLNKKVFMNGYSASGTFVNRFITIHPDRVQAIATGGINGLPILPYDNIKDENLIYPVGIYDLKNLVNKDFDLEAYRDVPQYVYLGEEDANDTLPYDDAFGDTEREIIINVFNTEPVNENKPENSYILLERFKKAE